jgi:phosphate/phosphite/phosphonate ABC transporter binding protein
MRYPGRLSTVFTLVTLVTLVTACESSKQKAEVITGKDTGKPVIQVASSDEAFVVFRKLAEEYAVRRGLKFEVVQTQSKNIMELLEKQSIEIGVSSRKLAPEAKEKGMSYVPFAFDGAVFLVSADAGVRSMTSKQIRKIYEGDITNWKEVGGADRKINIIRRPPYSSVTLTIGSSVFQGKFPQSKSSFVLETSEGTFQAVKSLSSYIATVPLSRTIVDHFDAVPIVLDRMEPLISRIPFEKYPAKLEYGIYFRKDAPEAVTEFANHLVSVDGMHQLASLGLVPARENLPLSACHCRATEGTFVPSKKSDLAGILTIAVVPELGAIQQENRYAGICQVIAEELGVKTQVKHMESYGRVIDEFAEGKIDAAFVGSLVYGHLHKRFGVLPLARPEKKGVSYYHGLIIVRENSGIRHFSQLRGKSFAYVPNTSAGELFTLSLTGVKEEDFPRYFTRVVTPYSHSDVVRLVESGKVDGGAVKDLVLTRMYGESPALEGKFRILAESSSFPENALVVSPLMSEKQRRQLRDILISCGEKEYGRSALSAMGAERFVPTGDGNYSDMYTLAESVDYDFGK